jgi:hypothetical protein
MIDKHGHKVVRTIVTAAKETATTHIISRDGYVTAGDEGAVFLLVEKLANESQGPFSTMRDVTTTNQFPQSAHVGADVRLMEFPFLKVETLDWAANGRAYTESS